MTVAYSETVFALPDDRRVAWRRHLLALAGVAAAILFLFRADVAKLVTIWWTNTTFGHCLFVGPVGAWLVWQRRQALAQLTPQAWWPGLALVAAGGLAWLLGDAASVSFARQLGLVAMLQGAAVTLLGANIARALLFPLAYATFLVPFGEWLEPPLQTVTVSMTMPLLHLVGVPASVDGVLITIPNGYFEVAEACSGSKFVIAMIVYGVLVAHVGFVSWRRRAAFMALALTVPVLANGLRAFATIYAAHLTSVARATGFDHIVFGWIFFAGVMAAVIALAWRWFDRAPDAEMVDVAALQVPARHYLPLGTAVALALATVALFIGWSAAIAGRAAPLPSDVTLPSVPGWTRVPLSTRAPWAPNFPGADHSLIGRYRNTAGDMVDLSVAVYGSQHEGKQIVGFGVGAIRQNDAWVRIADLPPLAGGAALHMTAPGPVERQVVTWYRLDGIVTRDPVRVKLATLRAKLLRGDQRATVLLASAEALPGHDPGTAITHFMAAAGPVDTLADRIAGGR